MPMGLAKGMCGRVLVGHGRLALESVSDPLPLLSDTLPLLGFLAPLSKTALLHRTLVL